MFMQVNRLNYSHDNVDCLAASMTSQRTIVSDAFDFLFDPLNLNPDKINQEIEEEARELKKSEKKSTCCLIS